MTAPTRSRPLVGRAREVAELTGALDAVAGGGARVVVLRGDPGIGKSRLCDEALELARARGFSTAAGRCWETPGAPPFWPWVQLVDELRTTRHGEAVDAQLGELGALLGGEGGATGEARRFRVSQLMARTLREVAQRPLLAIFEDLHAADLPSLELLQVTIRSTRTAPIAWLLTARASDARLTPELATALSRLTREGVELVPAPLQPGDVAAFATQTLGRELPAELVERLAQSTEGTPLFVEGTLRLLSTRRPDDTSPWPVPHGAHDVLCDRLAQIPEAAREVLELAAVIGRTCSRRLIALAAGAAIDDFDRHLAWGVESGVLRETTGDALAFSHSLLRDALEERLPARRRAELHWRVIGALRTGTAPAEELAHHALASLPLSDEDEAVAVVQRAGAAAEAVLAWHRAIELYRRALAVIDPGRVTARRTDLVLALSQALARSGQSKLAIEHAHEAATAARELADAERLARAALASGAVFRLGVVDRTLVRLLEEAIAALGPSRPELTVVLRARLASALQPAEDPAVPVRLALEAIDVARALGPDTLRQALHFGLSAMGDLTDAQRREPLLVELVEACRASGDRTGEHRARARLAMALYEAGKFAEADLCVTELERLGRELGPRWRVWSLLFRSLRALLDGRFDDARSFEQQLAATAELAGGGDFEAPLRMHHLFRLVAMGRGGELLAQLGVLRAQLEGLDVELVGLENVLLAVFSLMGGDLARARDFFSKVPEAILTYPDRGMLFANAMLAGQLADTGRAARLEPALAAVQQRFASDGLFGMAITGPYAWARGWLAHARGDVDRAHAEFTLALEEARRVGAKTFAARILHHRARLGRDPEDWPVVRAEFAALGYAFTDEGEPGAPAAPRAASPQPTTLVRDGEGWVLTAFGTTLRLKDSRGLQMLAQLIARPGVSIHSLELSGSEAAADTDSGEVLDARARAEYRERVEELRDELDEATERGDADRAEALRDELDFLARELSAAVGLGNRARKAGSHAERARSNVQRRLKDALKRIEEASPTVGRQLARAVKTGLTCTFEVPK